MLKYLFTSLLFFCSLKQSLSITITVTNNNDTGLGSLRQGIMLANSGDVINFSPTIQGATIVLGSELTIQLSVTIDGGTQNITIDGNHLVRCFSSSGFHDLIIKNITIKNGYILGSGAGINIQGGGNMLLENVNILDCKATHDGGGIYAINGSHQLKNVVISGNECSYFGGGYYTLNVTSSLENVLFSGNNAGRGGAAYLRGTTNLTNCTVSGNKANTGGGAFHIHSNGQVNMYNSIVWDNESSGLNFGLEAFYTIESFPTTITFNVTNSDIQGSGGSSSWDLNYGHNLGSNIDYDPLFLSPQDPVGAPTSDGNYELSQSSPCYNTALNANSTLSLDLIDHNRIAYGSIDMGCYEFCRTTSSIAVQVCNSYVTPSGSNTYTTSGTYTDTINNYLGCDSVITIDLTIKPFSYSTISETVCNSYVSPNGDIYKETGEYTNSIQATNGCDSIITINLTVKQVDTTLVIQNSTIKANAMDATFTWLNCDTGQPILGQTINRFTPAELGNYAVEITQNGCVSTTDCIYLDLIMTYTTAFSPNNDGVNDVLLLEIESGENTVTIFNRWGDPIIEFINYDDSFVVWDGTNQNGDPITGTCFFVIEAEKGQRSGWVEVVR